MQQMPTKRVAIFLAFGAPPLLTLSCGGGGRGGLPPRPLAWSDVPDLETIEVTGWLMGWGSLIQKATAVAWEQLLFVGVEELEQDPVKRMSLWNPAKSAVARQVYGTGERSH